MAWLLQEWANNWLFIVKWLAQLIILIGLTYFIYVRFIRKSHAEPLLKGLFIVLMMLVGLFFAAQKLALPMLEVVFGGTIQLLLIGLIVIFQPELRRTFLFLGQGEIFGLNLFVASTEEQRAEYLVHELVETVHFLGKAKRGALIVLESPNTHGGDYLEVGTALDAKLSTELMLTIFHPNTPLHDGAVVISPENRVVAAGVLLPLTEDPKLSWQYGTRHRAAIGLTEISDSRCIVVSEEAGTISLVEDGKLQKMANAEELRVTLARIYQVSVTPQPVKKVRLGERFTDLFSMETLPDPIQRIFYRRKGVPPAAPAPKPEKLPKSGTGP